MTDQPDSSWENLTPFGKIMRAFGLALLLLVVAPIMFVVGAIFDWYEGARNLWRALTLVDPHKRK